MKREEDSPAVIETSPAQRNGRESGLVSLDDFSQLFTNVAPPAEGNFRERLEAHLVARLTRQDIGNRFSLNRRIATRPFNFRLLRSTTLVSTMLVALLLLGVFTIHSPVRAWALDLLSYFGFSGESRLFPIGTELPANQDNIEPPSGCSQSGSDQIVCATGAPIALTREQAQDQLGFMVKAPTYLPLGYHAANGFEIVDDGKAVLWRAMYEDLCGPDITLVQSLAKDRTAMQSRVGEAAVVDVSVGDAQGVWIEDVQEGDCVFQTADGSTQVVPLTTNILAWEHNGIQYWLSTNGSLDMNQVLKIATSLQ